MDLFEVAQSTSVKEGPLAARMRPRTLDEYIGQDHIAGKGRLLRRAIAADRLSSVIFYGPPGTGKTTLARVIANHTKSNFVTLNAVLTGVQHIRDAVAKADEQRSLYNRRTILFVDEVHRWNKSQQDALLPWVENGTIILVGATTENPFFEVNKALVSRSRVFQLLPLTKDDLAKAAHAALTDKERGYGRWNVEFESGALEHLIDTANGDARSLLNALELAVETTPERWAPEETPCAPVEGSRIYISCETAEQSIQKKVVLYDRDGDYHYDIISAFIKSLRGRDPDAAMYWMARMLAAGEDPHFIFRRMLISACEDTGLADPHALGIVESCAAAFDRIGLPEGRFMLTQAALYLATCEKSNSTLCFFDALKTVAQEDAEVPNHLKDASRDSEELGHGKGYLYPHAYKDHWTAQQYLPDNLSGKVFYNPSGQGYEKTIRDAVLSRRELQIAALLEKTGSAYTDEPNSVANPAQDGVVPLASQKHGEFWKARSESERSETLRSVRDYILSSCTIEKNSRCLVGDADDGLLLWELNRKTPDGFTAGLCKTEQGFTVLTQYASTLEQLQRPVLIPLSRSGSLKEALKDGVFGDVLFDCIFYRNPVTKKEDIEKLCEEITALLPFTAQNAVIVIAQKIPALSQRLSGLLKDNCSTPSSRKIPKATTSAAAGSTDADTNGNSDGADNGEPLFAGSTGEQLKRLLEKAERAENEFYTQDKNPLFAWNEKTVEKKLLVCMREAAHIKAQAANAHIKTDIKIISEKRRISAETAELWFDTEKSSYGRFLHGALGKDAYAQFRRLFEQRAASGDFEWQSRVAFFTVTC